MLRVVTFNANGIRSAATKGFWDWFEKTDGTLRKATGTLRDVASMVKGTGRLDDGRTVRYYDVEASGFRSFRAESLITIYGL